MKNRQAEMESNTAKKEVSSVLEVFIKALKKKRRKYELVNDGNRVIFSKKKKTFFADLDLEDDFVTIYFLHNFLINLADETKLSVLRKAINASNRICGVTSYYDKKEADDNIIVLSKGTINFVLDNPNFELEIEMILDDCLSAQYVVKELMKKKPSHKTKQGFREIIP